MILPVNEIVGLLRRHFPKTQAIYLYGSAAANTATLSSDIDLAILSEKEIPAMERFEVAQEIAEKCKREVDLVDLRHVATVFQFQIVSTGQRLDTSDEQTCDQFEDFVYKSYAKLNEERALILNDIQARGKIF